MPRASGASLWRPRLRGKHAPRARFRADASARVPVPPTCPLGTEAGAPPRLADDGPCRRPPAAVRSGRAVRGPAAAAGVSTCRETESASSARSCAMERPASNGRRRRCRCGEPRKLVPPSRCGPLGDRRRRRRRHLHRLRARVGRLRRRCCFGRGAGATPPLRETLAQGVTEPGWGFVRGALRSEVRCGEALRE
jgi:hypothetical protein